MSRKTFLTVAALIALGVGAFALAMPAALLQSKGVAVGEAAKVWVREMGVVLIAIGVVALLLRTHADSPTLRAFLIGNVVLQIGLFPIEIVAWVNGVVTEPWGIVPNSLLHLLLAYGFAHFAARIRTPSHRA